MLNNLLWKQLFATFLMTNLAERPVFRNYTVEQEEKKNVDYAALHGAQTTFVMTKI